MKTPNACLTRTIQGPGLGITDSPAPATGHGRAIPTPSRKGSARAAVTPAAYRLLEKTMTWMTTGATQAPASSAATPPSAKATRNDPLPPGPPRFTALWKREKSMVTMSNMARPRTTNSAAIARLNHGDALIVPNVPAVRMTASPRPPYTSAMASPYALPSAKPRPRDPARVPAPMMARLIGIRGRTQGVRLSASPPMSTSARMASGPRPSNHPVSARPDSARSTKSRNSSASR